MYSFDVKIEQPLGYLGGLDPMLRIASWQGNLLHNFIYMFKLGAARGLLFSDEKCVAPDELGEVAPPQAGLGLERSRAR